MVAVLVSFLPFLPVFLLLAPTLLHVLVSLQFQLFPLNFALDVLVEDFVYPNAVSLAHFLQEDGVVHAEFGVFISRVPGQLHDPLDLAEVVDERGVEFVVGVLGQLGGVPPNLVDDFPDALHLDHLHQVHLVVDRVYERLLVLWRQLQAREHLQDYELQLVRALLEQLEVLHDGLHNAVVGVHNFLVFTEFSLCLVQLRLRVLLNELIIQAIVNKLLPDLVHDLVESLFEFLVKSDCLEELHSAFALLLQNIDNLCVVLNVFSWFLAVVDVDQQGVQDLLLVLLDVLCCGGGLSLSLGLLVLTVSILLVGFALFLASFLVVLSLL